MRIASMQPYFFPYLGYFSLMAAADRWVLFDCAQHIRKGWVTRNRVLSKGGAWKYIHLPSEKCPVVTPINQVQVRIQEDWAGKLLRNLDYYRERRAPYYQETMQFLRTALGDKEKRLSPLLMRLLQACNLHR